MPAKGSCEPTPDAEALIRPIVERPINADDVEAGETGTTRRSWLKAMAVLTFIFLLEFKPSEPFIEPYLRHNKGFTKDEVNNEIFPVWTYAYLGFAPVFGPLTEMGTYRIVIIAGAAARLSTRLLLLFGSSVPAMQIMQVAFGVGSATEVATSAFLYTLVAPEQFQAITSLARAASLLSHVGAAELGQLLVDLNPEPSRLYASYRTLMWVSLGTVSSATLLAACLPYGKRGPRPSVGRLAAEGLKMYRLRRVVVEALWWLAAASVLNLCYNFGTSRFDEVDSSKSKNGHIVAVTRLTSSVLALLAIRMRSVVARAPKAVYLLVCMSASAALVLTALADDLTLCAVGYASAVGLLEFLLCLVYARTAEALTTDCYALIIGINTFVALVVQSCIQLGLQHASSMTTVFMVLGAILCGGAVAIVMSTALWHGSDGERVGS